jgi:hypothetical protein
MGQLNASDVERPNASLVFGRSDAPPAQVAALAASWLWTTQSEIVKGASKFVSHAAGSGHLKRCHGADRVCSNGELEVWKRADLIRCDLPR